MLDRIIQLSLENRLVTLIASLVILVTGIYVTYKMPVDVLPDLTAPTVTIITESKGMAPEEVEALITVPMESALNGASDVRRIRSISTPGMSTVWVEFNWGADIYRARQIVNEKLQSVSAVLPAGAAPLLAPVSSVMGEIMYLALKSDNHDIRQLKETADFVIRKRLLAVSGVAQVVTVGGETKQYQILVDPKKLMAFGVSIQDVLGAVRGSNENFSAGVTKSGGTDYLIRGIGRVRAASDIESAVVTTRDGVPVLVRDVAEVKEGGAFRVGDASVDMHPAVVLMVSKQPDANTVELTKKLDAKIGELQKTLPPGMTIDSDIFRQSDFINRSISNIKRVLVEGAMLVVIILFLFLGNVRTTLISITAIPISLISAVFALRFFDITINTMTLGGMAIAVGVIVDDAIIDVENVFRRLGENAKKPENSRHPAMRVIFEASREIRSSIVNATLIIIVVFVPLFFLSGIEGKLLKPLGISYIVAIGASLVVALTLTPALCSYLLSGRLIEKDGESYLMRRLNGWYRPILSISLRRPKTVIAASVLMFALSMIPFAVTGRSFLPSFNEGSLVVIMSTAPGTSLEQSSEIAALVEKTIRSHPNVTKTSRRTGRGEMDEHGKFANASEIEASLEMNGRKLSQVLAELREGVAGIPGTIITFGQPISHRIDHMLSGTMANIAVKIFGPDLFRLKTIAEEVKSEMSGIAGVVDLSVEQQADIPQLRILPKKQELAKYGLTISGVAETLETAISGSVVSRTLEGDKTFDIVVKFAGDLKNEPQAIKNILIETPAGFKIPLSAVAEIVSAKGPNSISRENVQRKMVVQANVSDRDLRSVFEDVRRRVQQDIKLPEGYFIEYGGQFESEAEAARMIGMLSMVSLLLILVILYAEFKSFRAAFLVMVNLPLAFIGGIMAVFLTGGVINVATLVGFITLFGIATRNGILLVSHYRHLMDVEEKSIAEAVFQGSVERLRPVIMTALAAGLALAPFAFAADKPGNEILAPLAVVILGGLISSTALNMIVLPSLYMTFNRAGREA